MARHASDPCQRAEHILRNWGAAIVNVGWDLNRCTLRVEADWQPSGIRLRMAVNKYELMHDEHRWFRILSDEARPRYEANLQYVDSLTRVEPRWIGADPAAPLGDLTATQTIRDGDEEWAARQRRIDECYVERLDEMATRALTYDPIRFGEFTVDSFAPQRDPKRTKADKRAEELFLKVAGKQAHDQLNHGGLKLTGSKKGKYTLHPKMTYCVTRDKDGAQMCAVVPGVPLYDHLLGIKVMIEQDEPMFVKTANVTGDYGRVNNWFSRIHQFS